MTSMLRSALFTLPLLVVACTSETKVTPAEGQPQTQTPAQTPAQTPTQTPTQTPAQPAAANAPEASAPALADLGKILGAIKDGTTAAAAKPSLDALVQQLEAAKTKAAANATDALGGLGKVAADAAAKLGVGPEVVQQITALLDLPAVKAAIGPTLEKLQGLIK